MVNPRRLFVCVAALNVTVNVGVAMAQTVIVRKAPRGSTVELVVNTAVIASAPANDAGDANLAVNLTKTVGKNEIDAYMFVDSCDQVRRVLIVERGVTPPAVTGSCERKAIAGLFALRGVTTMVVDLSGSEPSMHLRQGPAPSEWLRDVPVGAPGMRRLAPVGLVVFGGGGLTSVSDAGAAACGNVINCSSDGSGFAYTGGVTFWFTPFVAAEVSYLRPANVTASGSGEGFRFDSDLDAHVFTLVGKVGAPIGPVRVYGQVGPDYHRATLTTTQTIDQKSVTVDGVTTTIPGGTQTLTLNTSGWGLLFGGGLEGWFTNFFAIYGEAGRALLKGNNRDGGEGTIDDGLTYIVVGARVHFGR
jgi:hypothetical protein